MAGNEQVSKNFDCCKKSTKLLSQTAPTTPITFGQQAIFNLMFWALV
jgi:hypothetical protein